MTNTKQSNKSRVMTLAWEIKRRNKKDFFGRLKAGDQLFTFSECLRLAWGLIKESLKGVEEAVSYQIDISRPNSVGTLRSVGFKGYTYRIE